MSWKVRFELVLSSLLRSESELLLEKFPKELISLVFSFWLSLIESKIIVSNSQRNKFVSMMEKQLKYPKNIQFKLLYRGSERGFSSAKFHELCNDKGPNVSIIQTEFGHICGGYISISWDSNKKNASLTFGSYNNYYYLADENAFLYLFSVKNDEILKSEKYCDYVTEIPFVFKITHPNKAVFMKEVYGPCYGTGHDLKIENKCNLGARSSSWLPSAYVNDWGQNNKKEILGGKERFRVIEYEIFSVAVQKE